MLEPVTPETEVVILVQLKPSSEYKKCLKVLYPESRWPPKNILPEGLIPKPVYEVLEGITPMVKLENTVVDFIS